MVEPEGMAAPMGLAELGASEVREGWAELAALAGWVDPLLTEVPGFSCPGPETRCGTTVRFLAETLVVPQARRALVSRSRRAVWSPRSST